MRQHVCTCALVFVLINLSGITAATLDQTDQYTEEKPAMHVPVFTSKPQTLYVDKGQSVTLECNVERLDPYVLFWKKDDSILRMGDQTMASDTRYNFVGNTQLTIVDLNKADEGKYICNISVQGTPLTLENTVRFKATPKIHPHPTHDIDASEGEVVVLRCPSEGQPPPSISWKNEGEPLRKTTTGVLKDENAVLEFTDIQGTDVGQYECVAENDVGKDTKVFKVRVKHTPVVTIKKEHFSAGHGVNMNLVCSVRADPPAEIRWFKDGKEVTENGRIKLKEKGNHYLTLGLTNADPVDFGKYRCEAKNKVGAAKAEVDVTGAPNRMTFLSHPYGSAEDSYNIEFYTESMSPIIDYQLAIRKANLSDSDSKDWHIVVIPTISQSTPRYKYNHVLTQLQPATVYDVYMTAINEYGTSLQSELFQFTTLGGTFGDQAVTQDSTAATRVSTAAPQSVKELKSQPSGTNGSPPLEQRAKIVAVMTVIILIAFF